VVATASPGTCGCPVFSAEFPVTDVSLAAAVPPVACPERVEGPTLRGDLAVWVFILAELLAFGVFFLAYAFARARHPAEFDAAQAALDRQAGALNTLLLVSSSALVAHAVALIRSATAQASRHAAHSLLGAIACGLGFIVVKGHEYATHFAAGMELSSSTFSMFYLGLTGFHFFHVLLGLAVLSVLWRQTARGAYTATNANGLESGAAYWHMVDLVWLVLFPLVYVMR
jgi:nitric oxide reductase NorE protein